jgi:PAS domain S-box-containing protein
VISTLSKIARFNPIPTQLSEFAYAKVDTDGPGANEVELLKEEIAILREIRRDYEEIVDHGTEVIFKLDSTGNFSFVSTEYKRMFDFTNEEMKGRHFTSILHPKDVQICVETVRVLEQFGKAPHSIDFRVRHKNGSYKWVNCSAVCLFKEDGTPSHTLGLAHDVSRLHDLLDHLRASETALRKSEERYRSLFEALGEGVVLVNAEGKVIAANRCASNIFHSDNESVLAHNVFENDLTYIQEDGSPFPPSAHPSMLTLATGRSFKDVVIGVQKSGQLTWISVNTEPIYYSDKRERPDAVVASFSDITQAKKDKSELIRNQQLLAQESERYVTAMKTVAEAVVDAQEKERAGIGVELHDNVNQILSTVRLYLDLALLNDKDRVELIRRSSEGLANAVNEIRKISHSLVPASLSDLGLVASIEDLINSVRATQQIHAEFYHIGNVENISDKHKLVLFRMIQEQVTNVLKHAEAKRLIIELTADDSWLSLAISDDGKGCELGGEKIKKGVGLYNIANRAELFNGKLNIITSPGKGFKLNVLIPI